MKYVVFVLCTVIVMTASFSARAEDDSIAAFMKICTDKGASQTFCQCSLEKFSDTLRKTANKEFEKRQETVNSQIKVLLEDPALDQGKIDAVCDLHNLSIDYSRKITALRGKGQADLVREYKKKKSKATVDKMNLIQSYNLKPNTSKVLGGNFCQEKLTLAENKIDMAEDDGGIYPELKRLLEFNMSHYYSVVMSMGKRSKCPD